MVKPARRKQTLVHFGRKIPEFWLDVFREPGPQQKPKLWFNFSTK